MISAGGLVRSLPRAAARARDELCLKLLPRVVTILRKPGKPLIIEDNQHHGVLRRY
jgi:hypothetical protein